MVLLGQYTLLSTKSKPPAVQDATRDASVRSPGPHTRGGDKTTPPACFSNTRSENVPIQPTGAVCSGQTPRRAPSFRQLPEALVSPSRSGPSWSVWRSGPHGSGPLEHPKPLEKPRFIEASELVWSLFLENGPLIIILCMGKWCSLGRVRHVAFLSHDLEIRPIELSELPSLLSVARA